MEWRRRHEAPEEFKAVERGWCLGGEEFRQELLEQVSARTGPSHFGPAVQEAAEAVAERLVVAGLKRLAWTGEELASRRKGDPAKLKIAGELRRKTTPGQRSGMRRMRGALLARVHEPTGLNQSRFSFRLRNSMR